jgi:MinD-like ATPase involved in chromosome partitioning or flagellar assembly
MTRVALLLPRAERHTLSVQVIAAGDDLVYAGEHSAELIALVVAERADIVVTIARPEFLDAEVIEACDLGGVRLAALASAAEECELADLLNFAQVVPVGSGWETARACARGELPNLEAAPGPDEADARPPAEPPAPLGHVIAVWGPTGAPGRSTVAINLAAELALEGRRVVLVDADTYGGAIAPLLGLPDEVSGVAAACRLAGMGDLSREQLARLGQRVQLGASEMTVLTGILRPERWPELTADRLRGMLTCLVEWFDAVVVDVGFNLEADEEITSDLFAVRRNEATATALTRADLIVEVTGSDALSLTRFLRAHTELVEAYPDARRQVVANRIGFGTRVMHHGEHVTHTLERYAGVRDPILLPWDQTAVTAMVEHGQPLCRSAQKSPLRSALREAAARVALPAPVG